MLLNVSHISKAYGEDVIVDDATFFVDEGKKYAIIGPNGCGKSTLLKIIAGQLNPSNGDITIAKDKKIGYLAQYQEEFNDDIVLDSVLEARSDLIEMEKKLISLEEGMSSVSESELDKYMSDYEIFHDKFDRMGGYTFKSEAVGILKGLGFDDDALSKHVSELSGGQKTRVALGRLLIAKPDLLLLDEPINHLDLNSIMWLEDFLSNYPKAIIIVAHDRYFLDKICDHIVDISMKKAFVYTGNYTDYVAQKEINDLTYQRTYDKQQKEIAHQQEVIDKLQSFNREKSIKRAESRKKMLSKIEVMEALSSSKAMSLNFYTEKLSGKDVLYFDNVSKSYSDKTVFKDLTFEMQRGDRVAILGDNGCGKTTVLKCINEVVPYEKGSIKIGANIDIGYYDQEQQNLDEANTIFDEIHNSYPSMTGTQVRNALAGFLFTEDDVFKRISDLSGGERARVSLLKLSLSGCNFLILDEPTNHLDMQSKEVLEEALNAYEGTILFVSHDRYFVNRIAKTILEMNSSGFTKYIGNYDEYISKKNALIEEGRITLDSSKVTNNTSDINTSVNSANEGQKLSWEEQKAIAAQKKKHENAVKKIEDEISNLEAIIADLDEQLALPENSANSAKLNELFSKKTKVEEELEVLLDKWEALDNEMS